VATLFRAESSAEGRRLQERRRRLRRHEKHLREQEAELWRERNFRGKSLQC